MTKVPRIAVCVATYKRPEFLRGLLESIKYADMSAIDPLVIVVDNDPEGSGRSAVEDAAQDCEWPIRYSLQTKRGIPAVRNSLISEAAYHGASHIAFVDDDEFVDSKWLVNLWSTMVATGADAVFGHRLPHYEQGVPQWVVESGYFQSRSAPTGTRIRQFATNNVLISVEAFQGISGPFDEARALTGGTDTILSRTMHRRGRIIVQCKESITYERITATRASVSWILARAFRGGVTGGIVASRVDHSAKQLIMQALSAMERIVRGSVLTLLSIGRGRATWVPRVSTVANGVGFFVGAVFGRHLSNPYEATHGN